MKSQGARARVAGVLVVAAALVAAVPASAGERYEVDPVHSSIVFKIGHLGVGYVYGAFTDFKGSFELDKQDPAKSRVDLTINTDSVTTHNEKRDKHLRSPDFFNTKQFPHATFKSTSVRKAGDAWEVEGNLTLNGVARPHTIKLQPVGEGSDPQGKHRAGFEGTLTVDRLAHGIEFMKDALGKDVQVLIAFEGVRQ